MHVKNVSDANNTLKILFSTISCWMKIVCIQTLFVRPISNSWVGKGLTIFFIYF